MMCMQKTVAKLLEVKIDPQSIPTHEYDLACNIIFAGITLAMKNPALCKEYESWKSQRGDAGR